MILKQLLVLLGSAPRIQSREGLRTKKQNTYVQALGPEMEIRPSGECLGKALESGFQSNSHSQWGALWTSQ